MGHTDVPAAYELSPSEIGELDQALGEVEATGDDPGGEELYRRSWELPARLPAGLHEFLDDFRRTEPAAACLIGGLPVDDAALGPTPATWQDAAQSSLSRREELYLALVGMTLGEPFSWSTLQAGRMIHNVLPIAGEGGQQSGHGEVLLEWHVEDAFHPYRCDYLVLLGLRNHDAVATTISSIRDVHIPDDFRTVLAEPRFHILPDDEHLRQVARRDPDHPGLVRMRRMREHPEPVAVLFGDHDDPYLRIDPYFMRALDGEANLALKWLVTELEHALQDVVVDAGSVLVVDNFRAVHGRREFKARFDGTDRWLKKMVVSRDLRRSRDERPSAVSRIVF
jgi:L-asparagine oxygenase